MFVVVALLGRCIELTDQSVEGGKQRDVSILQWMKGVIKQAPSTSKTLSVVSAHPNHPGIDSDKVTTDNKNSVHTRLEANVQYVAHGAKILEGHNTFNVQTYAEDDEMT